MDQVSFPTNGFIVFQDGHNHLQECRRNELINNGIVDPWFEVNREDTAFHLSCRQKRSYKLLEKDISSTPPKG